jgi:hypothetical protein
VRNSKLDVFWDKFCDPARNGKKSCENNFIFLIKNLNLYLSAVGLLADDSWLDGKLTAWWLNVRNPFMRNHSLISDEILS